MDLLKVAAVIIYLYIIPILLQRVLDRMRCFSVAMAPLNQRFQTSYPITATVLNTIFPIIYVYLLLIAIQQYPHHIKPPFLLIGRKIFRPEEFFETQINVPLVLNSTHDR
jgi:hypothetical protein